MSCYKCTSNSALVIIPAGGTGVFLYAKAA